VVRGWAGARLGGKYVTYLYYADDAALLAEILEVIILSPVITQNIVSLLGLENQTGQDNNRLFSFSACSGGWQFRRP